MKLISACMMVKNEEELLEDCLNSLKGTVDELCIIDTGSTDNTIKIINDFSNNQYDVRVRFKEIPWNDDFSWMRNQSIDMATTRWVFIIDADERLKYTDQMSARMFRDELKKIEQERPDVKSLAIQLKDMKGSDCVMTCASARIFSKDVRYRGIIHNTPEIKSDSIFLPRCIIEHYGYDLSEEKMNAKFERTKNALFKQLKDDPDNKHTEFYLCQLYGTRNILDEARKWGEKYIDNHVTGDQISTDINPTVFYSLGRIYVETDEIEKAERVCAMGLSVNIEDPDLFVVKADIHNKKGQLLEMASASKTFLILQDKINKSGLTGKFYFSLNDRTKNVMIQRVVVGAMGEALNAAVGLYTIKDVDKEIISALEKQFEDWGLSVLTGEIRDRASRAAKPKE